jgi:hypothetical protein
MGYEGLLGNGHAKKADSHISSPFCHKIIRDDTKIIQLYLVVVKQQHNIN